MLTLLVRRWRRFAPASHALLLLGAVAVVTWLTLMPTPPPPPSHWLGFDKLAHFGCWAGMAFLAVPVLAVFRPDWHAAWLAFGAAAVYGAAIELIQLAVPGRSGELLDLVADVLGAAVGVAVARWLWRLGPNND